MRIGIIGAGSMGETLARHLSSLGHHVSIANSRGPKSLTALAAEIGAMPVSVVEAAQAGEIVILAIPTKAVADLPKGLFASVPSNVIVIDIGNYHPELRDGRIDAIDQGMLDSRWVAQQIGRPVIKAFNNIFAKSLLEKDVPKGTKGRIALSVAGDSSDAKAIVLRLVDDLGFDPVDAGDLDNSWRQQPGTPAYCRDLDAAALRRALAEADRSRIAEYRAEQEVRIRKQIAAQTTMVTPFSGGCACGAIRYQSTAKPVLMLHCHCRDCQQASGGPFSSYVIVPKESFRVTKGSPRFHNSPSEAGGKTHRGFCTNCGAPIVVNADAAPQYAAIRTASLDDPSWFNLQMDVWTCDAHPWDQMNPALPKFEKYPK